MKQNNIKIAVTGGIGSGKTTVCNFIREKGYPVFSCDDIYAELLNGGNLAKEIANQFGKEILNGGGGIDRKKLSERVFDDKIKLQKLNEITHRAIFEEAFLRAENLSGIIFFEVPLLFEGGYQNLFDEVIVVLREVDERILSVSRRDNLSSDEIKKRINNQFNYNNCDFAQYYVIHNQGKIDNMSDIISEILLKITQKYPN